MGTANFDRISVKIYKDNTAQLEALKAGEFDLMRFFSAGDWARRVNGKKFRHGGAGQGRVRSTSCPRAFKAMCSIRRRPFLQDVRVREALGLALDYRVDEPPDVLWRLPAREWHVWQHRLRDHGKPVARRAGVDGAFGASTCPPQRLAP